MPIYRYKLASVDISRIAKVVPGALTLGSTGPDVLVDIDALIGSKDDLDAAMAQLGYAFFATDPLNTPAQQSAVSTSSTRKSAVRMASTVNLVLSGLQTIDTIVGAAGDRVLVKNQTTPSQNGIYVMGSAAWLRSDDADTGDKLLSASDVRVSAGATQAGTAWYVSTTGVITIGVTAITWTGVGQADSSMFLNIRTPTIITPPQITANQNDYDPAGFGTANIVVLDLDANRTITGFAAPTGTDQSFFGYNNRSASTLVLPHLSVLSAAGNRIATPGQANYNVAKGAGGWMFYDFGVMGWRILAV